MTIMASVSLSSSRRIESRTPSELPILDSLAMLRLHQGETATPQPKLLVTLVLTQGIRRCSFAVSEVLWSELTRIVVSIRFPNPNAATGRRGKSLEPHEAPRMDTTTLVRWERMTK
jgi:hypothetical protein